MIELITISLKEKFRHICRSPQASFCELGEGLPAVAPRGKIAPLSLPRRRAEADLPIGGL